MSETNVTDQVANNLSAAALLLDEWKWRHQHCWKLLNRFGLAGLTVALIPYVRRLDLIQTKISSVVDVLGTWELFFPITALIMGQAAVWLFTEEYIRSRPVITMYYRVLALQGYNPVPVGSISPKGSTVLSIVPLTFKSIGQSTILVYSILVTLISLFNTWLIIVLAKLPINQNYFWMIGSILSLLLTAGALYVSWRSGERIKGLIKLQEDREPLPGHSSSNKSTPARRR